MIFSSIGCDAAHFELGESTRKRDVQCVRRGSNGTMLSRCLMVIFEPSRLEQNDEEEEKEEVQDANIHLEIVYEYKCINHQNSSACACVLDMR